MGHWQNNGRNERATGLSGRTREEAGKVESNDSAEIPDGREMLDIPYTSPASLSYYYYSSLFL